MHNQICQICDGADFDEVTYPGGPNTMLDFKAISICRSCGFGFVSPLPQQQELDRFYNEGNYWGSSSRDPYLAAHNRIQSFQRAKMFSKYFNGSVRVLDVGAGTGTLMEALKGRFSDVQYDFIEPDAELAKSIRLRNQNRSKSFSNLGEISEVYDLIFLNHVVEHVRDSVTFLNEVKEKLVPNGLIYLEVPHGDYKTKKDVFPHTLFFTESSIEGLAKKTGLKVVEVKNFGRNPGQAWSDRATQFGFKVAARLGLQVAERYFASPLFQVSRDGNGIWLGATLRKL